MIRRILVYGTVAGVMAGAPLSLVGIGTNHHLPPAFGLILGYAIMLVALSAVFVAVKRYRDMELGGVIGFWRALALGLGISVVAGIFYMLAWEITLALTHIDFASGYAKLLIAQEKAKGVTGPALAKFVAQMDEFKKNYANPFYRMGETFTEIFPVGVLVSLVSAGLLRNRRFLPARSS